MSKNNIYLKGQRVEKTDIESSFVENQTSLMKFISRFIHGRQDVEDVLQETFLRAYSTERKKEIEFPKAFLFKIARNIALTELTKKSRQITDLIEDCDASIVIDSMANVESELEAQQTLGIYCEAIAQLPEKCRRVYLLRKVHGLSHKEIAQRMGVSVSSVEKYLARGVVHCQHYVLRKTEPQKALKSSSIK